MRIISKTRRQFIAKIVADLGKAIFAIGLARYFFEKFSLSVRVLLGIACVILLLGSIFIQPREEGGESP